jgi:hypothetical protein
MDAAQAPGFAHKAIHGSSRVADTPSDARTTVFPPRGNGRNPSTELRRRGLPRLYVPTRLSLIEPPWYVTRMLAGLAGARKPGWFRSSAVR